MGLVAISLLVLDCAAADKTRPAKISAIYEQTMKDCQAGQSRAALRNLATIHSLATRGEDKAEALRLQGAILTWECEYEAAEIVLNWAIEFEPKLWAARFNLAQLSFLKRDWVAARRRFEAMPPLVEAGMGEKEARELVRYQILLTYVLEGNEAEAAKALQKFEVQPESPALYFSRAAIARQHGHTEAARIWMAEARERFSPACTRRYAEAFYELGWERRAAREALFLPDAWLGDGPFFSAAGPR